MQAALRRSRGVAADPLPGAKARPQATTQRKAEVAADVNAWANWEHHFLLTPRARVRRALRRARTVPLLLRVTSYGVSYNNRGLTRTTQAEIELTGPRRKRR